MDVESTLSGIIVVGMGFKFRLYTARFFILFFEGPAMTLRLTAISNRIVPLVLGGYCFLLGTVLFGGCERGKEHSNPGPVSSSPEPESTSMLGVGDAAPKFALLNATGHTVELDTLLQQGPVIVAFYRGAWCPYCNTELHDLAEALPEIQKLGAQLVAISPQTPDHSLSTVEKNDLPFEVLSDSGNKLADQFGIVFILDHETREKYKGYGVDLAEYNGDDTWQLPHPATYIIDQQGTIRFAFVNTDYKIRAQPSEILAALQGLKNE